MVVLRQGGYIVQEDAEQEENGPKCTSNFFFSNACFFNVRERGTKRGGRTVEAKSARATVEPGMVGNGGKARSSGMVHALLHGTRPNVAQTIRTSLPVEQHPKVANK